ncbi:hypothetical protein [Cryobacterium sp. Hb1]|uniref:hypothetical protein n=1 Tax=Cryobacterium sp. Hb1 TaxID=1259147 RepID=UPI00141AEBC9
MSAACCPKISQIERRNPLVSELFMVSIAPAPEVNLISTPGRKSQPEGKLLTLA